MSTKTFSLELDQFGPQSGQGRRMTLDEACQYCRKTARSHYENFSVASWLLPKDLRQHFYNVYAYCRWADDLADESGDASRSLELLDWWQEQLGNCYRGRAEHPVFLALTTTIEDFNIPQKPFADLLIAFRHDQRTKRYETFDDLLGYCRNSANPVGKLVLYLGRCVNDENLRLSDSICTGLQLANFWQDVARDFDQGRIYLPQESCRRFGYTDEMWKRRLFNDPFHRMLESEVNRAQEFLLKGLPLVDRVSEELRIDIDLFIHGGLTILKAIQKIDFNVWSQRPTVGKLSKLKMLVSAWIRSRSRR